jgi:hypothetical protein
MPSVYELISNNFGGNSFEEFAEPVPVVKLSGKKVVTFKVL